MLSGERQPASTTPDIAGVAVMSAFRTDAHGTPSSTPVCLLGNALTTNHGCRSLPNPEPMHAIHANVECVRVRWVVPVPQEECPLAHRRQAKEFGESAPGRIFAEL